MDPQIEQAIRKSVSDNGQSTELANRIVAWMAALTEGNEEISDLESSMQRARILYESVVLQPEI